MAVVDGGTIDLGGKTVNRLGYGAMRITGDGIWGPPSDRHEAVRVLRRAVELGVTFIDTADSYGPCVSEDLIREALHDGTGYGGVLVATKGGLTRSGPDIWESLGRPEYLRQCVQMSLRRLGLERIDLWQLHRIDPNTPREETFGAIKEMVDTGLIRDVGLSQVDVDEINAAQAAGLTVASVQNLYNLAHRKSDNVVDFCAANGIAFIPWFPIASGDLAKPGGPLDKIAHHHEGASVAQLALAWLLHRSPVIVPIPGTSSMAHLEQNLGAADVKLTDENFQTLADAA